MKVKGIVLISNYSFQMDNKYIEKSLSCRGWVYLPSSEMSKNFYDW